MDAHNSVAQDDICSLRIICSNAQNRQYDLEKVDHYGNTALLKACYLGRLECARILIDFDANIKAINYYGQNALTLATHSGNYDLVRDLLHHRSYDDFNLSSLVPALCVAIMCQHAKLIDFFNSFGEAHNSNLSTCHGLSVGDMQDMFQQAKPKQ